MRFHGLHSFESRGLRVYTELKAQSSMEALQELQTGEAQVVRTEEGRRCELTISAEQLVPGAFRALEYARIRTSLVCTTSEWWEERLNEDHVRIAARALELLLKQVTLSFWKRVAACQPTYGSFTAAECWRWTTQP